MALRFILFMVISCSVSATAVAQILERRAPWTTSKVKGSPDPPLPYKIQRVFSNVELEHPTDIVWLPDAKKWIATQVTGEIVVFENDVDHATTTPLLDLNRLHEKQVFRTVSTTFHHDLANQPWCFVTYASEAKADLGYHLVRFKVLDPAVPTLDLSSRTVLMNWSSSGHSGGSMLFGPDNYFYVSIGDGQPPYPPDELNTGQNLSDIEASILRIDVDNPTDEVHYRIPADNPFVDSLNARDEIWAYGFRNPWKMAFNPENGDLFAADVGWEMREMIYRVKRGGNYGWSIMEGSQPVKQEETPSVPITPPIFEHSHIDSRSITGGYFWQSDRIEELKGAYIYGDWMTGKVWALKTAGDRVLWQKELVDTPLQIICFMLDPTGEVLLVGYDGTIHRLLPNDTQANHRSFPKRLADTGLFRDVSTFQSEQGVIEYEISAHHWADGTHSRQWIAIPNSKQLGIFVNPRWDTGHVHGRFEFPQDTVLAKTVSYFSEAGEPASERHIETQLLHLLGDEWRAYNYIWNEEQTEAILQDDIASESKLTIRDPSVPDGFRTQTWHHSSRSECLLCHIWSSGTVHGFAPDQINISWRDKKQLPTLKQAGLFSVEVPTTPPIASPHDVSRSLEDRARSYLALNCSTCHRPQGGGTADFNFDHTKTLSENRYLDALPSQGSFDISDARVVASGDPFRSVVMYRALKFGRGHMPQFGSNVMDREGVKLVHDWIASLPSSHGLSARWDNKIAQLHAQSDPESAIEEILQSTYGALALSFACGVGDAFDPSLKDQVVRIGSKHNTAQIRDLFEGYLPEEQRTERLGPSIDADALLAITGSADAGKLLFEKASDVTCRQCHRLGSVGKDVGPDLRGIGTQQTPGELLTSILRPSENISQEYRTRSVLTDDGNVLTGIVLKQSKAQMVLSDSQGKEHTIATDSIEQVQVSPKSIMPEMLFAGLTRQQAADLLAFLSSQRKIGPLQHKRTTVQHTDQMIEIDGRRDEAAWDEVSSVGDFVFTWWNEGDGQRQQTDARLLWDDENLYISFYCLDRDVKATRTERDSDVYRDDCVEVFASPELSHPENYFNLEINARGTLLDNYRPDGKNPDQEWNPSGIRIATTIAGTLNDSTDLDKGWLVEVAIPFKIFKHALPHGHPQSGDRWRLNLNRLNDNMKVKSQWSQGDRNFPRFHHPEYFGFVQFQR